MKRVSKIQLKVKKILIKLNRGELITGDNLNKSQNKRSRLGDHIHTQEEREELEEGATSSETKWG